MAADAVAGDYENKILADFGTKPEDVKFDLLLLGMGPDGHTCSLFPGHPLLEKKDSLVAFISDSPKPPPQRITLTYTAINNAAAAAFVCAGEGKADMLHRVHDKKVAYSTQYSTVTVISHCTNRRSFPVVWWLLMKSIGFLTSQLQLNWNPSKEIHN